MQTRTNDTVEMRKKKQANTGAHTPDKDPTQIKNQIDTIWLPIQSVIVIAIPKVVSSPIMFTLYNCTNETHFVGNVRMNEFHP